MGLRVKTTCVNSVSNALPDAASRTNAPTLFNAIKSVVLTKTVYLLETAVVMATVLRALCVRAIRRRGTIVTRIANALLSFAICNTVLHMINIK